MSAARTRRLPPVPPTSAPHFQAAHDGQLVLQQCTACETFRHFPRGACPSCHATEDRWQPVRGAGTVYTYTVVHHTRDPFFAAMVPYAIALVELDDLPGVRLLGHVVDCDVHALHIGTPVIPVFEQVTDGLGVVVFAPSPPA